MLKEEFKFLWFDEDFVSGVVDFFFFDFFCGLLDDLFKLVIVRKFWLSLVKFFYFGWLRGERGLEVDFVLVFEEESNKCGKFFLVDCFGIVEGELLGLEVCFIRVFGFERLDIVEEDELELDFLSVFFFFFCCERK